MNKQSKAKEMKTNKKEIIDPVKLEDALFYMQDILERSQIPFMVFGKTAKHIHRGERLDGDEEINLGIKKSELTPSQVSTLKFLIPDIDMNEYQISCFHNDIPIIIDVIHTDYNVFQYPDKKLFIFEWFSLPNPFSEYWQKKDFIK